MATKLTAVQRKARNLRFTAGAAFYVSAALTMTANMYASKHTLVGLAIGMWTPVAFFLSLELMERMPKVGAIGKARIVSISVLAFIAGWESYWHLVHVMTEGGADTVGRYLMPLTVDILMVISRMAMNQKAAPARPRSRRTSAKASNVRKLRSA